MIDDRMTRLETIDLAVLTDVVQQDQDSPSFEIRDWSVNRLSDQGFINPDGLWLFSGEGSDNHGQRPWSVVLKIIDRPKEEPPPSNLIYWRRELLLAQSGLTESMPGPVKAPRFYHASESPDSAWVWMEHIVKNRSYSRVLDEFSFAAHQIGIWNGAYVTGTPLTYEPWLAKRHYLQFSEGDREGGWQFPLHQKWLSDDTRIRCDQIWEEREVFFKVLEELPQTFSHFDSNRRNQFSRKRADGQDELVLIDWAQCGIGALGAEISTMVGYSFALNEWPPNAVYELDAVVFKSYLQGLRDAGWSGDADVVRLGYTAFLAIWSGAHFPDMMAFFCSPEARQISLRGCGYAEEDLYLHWLPAYYYFWNCADEARLLMRKLGFY